MRFLPRPAVFLLALPTAALGLAMAGCTTYEGSLEENPPVSPSKAEPRYPADEPSPINWDDPHTDAGRRH